MYHRLPAACAHGIYEFSMNLFIGNEWGLCFRQCKVCGKYFLAKSQRYELCSDKCRKAQALQNKREFEGRARENNYDLFYKNECQNWRNIPANQMICQQAFRLTVWKKIQAAFADFKATNSPSSTEKFTPSRTRVMFGFVP